MKQYTKDFIEECARTGALSIDTKYLDTGEVGTDFWMKDGRRALYFLNTAKFCGGKSGIILGIAYASKIMEEDLAPKFDILYGPAYKGITIVNSTTIELQRQFEVDRPWVYRRKEAKDHAEKGDFVGADFSDGCRLLMEDDVLTSTGTKFTEMAEVSAFGQKTGMRIKFIGLLIGLDRQQKAVIGGKVGEGGKELGITAAQYFALEKGIPVSAITSSGEAMPYLHESRTEGPDGRVLVTDAFMLEFEKYQREFGVR